LAAICAPFDDRRDCDSIVFDLERRAPMLPPIDPLILTNRILEAVK